MKGTGRGSIVVERVFGGGIGGTCDLDRRWILWSWLRGYLEGIDGDL